jgi:CheY-like chemotaxis protein
MAAGGLYVAALVARTAADDLAADLWTKVKAALAAKLGREPEPKDVTPKAIDDIAKDPGIQHRFEAMLGKSSALRRAQVVERAIRGARILWVDDHPEGNIWEHNCLITLGAHVKTVETTRTAVACLEREGYDLLISDIDREGRGTTGLYDLPRLHSAGAGLPVVFYVMNLQPGVPPGAFGVTAHPDALLHLCMDALERTRL